MAVATKQVITVGAHSPGITGLRGKKVSTLHREKELRPVTYNGSDSSEEEEENNGMIVSRTPPQSTAPGERWKIEHRPSLPFEVCQREVGKACIFFYFVYIYLSVLSKKTSYLVRGRVHELETLININFGTESLFKL